MRLSLSTIICMLVSFNLLWAVTGKGQTLEERKISMEVSNVTLERALAQVEKLSGFRIAYASENVEKYGRVSLNMATRSVSATLKALLQQTGLAFKLTDNTIMIVTRAEVPGFQATPQPRADTTVKIQGRITDETGVAMPGVSIRVQGTTKGVFSDANGNYSLEAGPGQVLVFSSVGSIQQEHVVGKGGS